MASQHSFLESFCAGNSLLLHGGGATARVRPRFASAAAYRPKNPSECRLRLASGRPLCLNGLRATGQSSAGGGNEDDEDFADEGLRETIKQSKKALAVQRDLLQQIVERRKIMSSMKNTIVDPRSEVSGNERDSYFSSLGQSVSSGELDKKYDNDVSNGHAQPTKTELTEGQPIAAYRNFLDEEKEPGNSSQVKYLLADVLGLSREASPGADETVIVSPSLLKISESIGVETGNLKELTEPVIEGASAGHDDMEQNFECPPLAGPNVMNIVLAAAECAPWSKTGGLGDVAGALPKALARRGHRVMVVAPMYGMYAEPQEIGARKRYKVDGQDMEVSYFHAYIDGVDFVFLESPIFRHRENDIYGGNRVDILKRMVLFCKAAVEVPWHVPCGGVCYGDGNLVFIANDWHTALLPVYLKAYYRDHGLMKFARCLLVIHNIAHQGRGPVHDFNYVDLPGQYMDLFRLYDPAGGEHFNIFAAGLKTADRVVTVSHGYAWELKSPEGGWGLHWIINENDWKFHGIVNGVDTEDWNPNLDVHLKSDGYINYSLETLETGKAQCKAALQQELGLPVRNDVPILAFIGRLDHQKGVDLIAEAIPWIVNQDVQLIMLGSGRTDLEELLRNLENHHHDKVRGWVGFSVKMAHRITAGADVLLMPSRFEPCGLNQLYAMMYGTIPVVHAVGGLRDTVHQYDPYCDTGYGWTFERAEANRLIDALGHCLNTYRNYRTSWAGIQRRGMQQDLSWDNAAQHYEEVLLTAKYQW